MKGILIILNILLILPGFARAAFAVITRDTNSVGFYQNLFINQLNIQFMVYDYNSQKAEALEKFKSGMFNHVFADDCLYDMTDELGGYPCYFWMAYPLAQKKCSKNVIYYSSFVPMMISCILYIYLFSL